MATRTIESKGYDNGYNDAIEAIKQALQGGSASDGGGSGMTPDPKLNMPDIDSNSKQSNQNSSNKNSSKPSVEKGKKDGVVNAEDCAPIENVKGSCKEPGGLIDSNTGDQIAKKEGYEPIGGSDGLTEKEWKEKAIKAANKHKGNIPGKLVSKIEGLYKVSHDWKKELRKIVGQSISPDDKRQAYANKNVLVSQDRIARTDKDKYDNMDYMMAWIDSSGSMSDDQLKKVLSEVYYVALAKKPIKLIIVQCDTQIQEIKEYRNLGELKKDMIHASVKGRGGTELKPCWDLLLKNPKYKKRPAELVMVFTDGYLTQYKRNPKTMKNLCWVILDNPSFNLQYKEIATKCVHLKTDDIK